MESSLANHHRFSDEAVIAGDIIRLLHLSKDFMLVLKRSENEN